MPKNQIKPSLQGFDFYYWKECIQDLKYYFHDDCNVNSIYCNKNKKEKEEEEMDHSQCQCVMLKQKSKDFLFFLNSFLNMCVSVSEYVEQRSVQRYRKDFTRRMERERERESLPMGREAKIVTMSIIRRSMD